VQDVHALLSVHHGHGLLSSRDEDAHLANALARAISAGQGAEAYLLLLELRRGGPALDRSLDLVEQIYGVGAVVEFRTLAPASGGSSSYNWQTGSDRKPVLDFLREHDGLHNLYIGVNPRAAHLRDTTTPGDATSVAARRFIVFDYDNKDAKKIDPNWQRAVATLCNLPQLMVVASGNGTHLWFQIEDVTDAAESAAITSQAKALMAAVGSDPSVSDAPRIMRLPFTINIPDERKRENGAKLALAHPAHGPDPDAKVWPWRDLVAAIAGAFDLDPDNLPRTGAGGASAGGAVSLDAMPPEMLRAPSIEVLEALAALLPNGDDVDRKEYVSTLLAFRLAAEGFDADGKARAKAAALRWSGKWPFANADSAHEDERVYDTAKPRSRGFPHLMADLRATNPAGWQLMMDRLAPLRQEAARQAFADVPFPPEQQHWVPDPANDNGTGPTRSGGSAGANDPEDPDPRLAGAKGRSAAQRALEALRATGAEFFSSRNGRTWIILAGRVSSLDSEGGIRAVLAWLLVHAGIAVTGNAKNELKDLLRQRAYIGEVHRVHYRQAEGPNPRKPAALINLMDGRGDGIRVDGSGWSVTPLAAMPVRFTDREGALPLPRPVRANDGVGLLDRLGRHIPLHPIQQAHSSADAGVQQRANLLLFLLNQFYRPGTAVHLFLNAPQGSGKTMTARRLKGLTDPDTATILLSLPSDEGTVFAIAQQQTSLALDNLSSMKGDAADLFCGLATGAAQQRRTLYTNADRHISAAQCSVIFTSIREDLIQRPDLMDRTVTMDLPPLDRKDRRTEADLNAAWERDLPHLLADLLDALSGALARLDAVRAGTKPEDLPRFTDAALLAEAAAQGLGWQPGLCLAAINASRQSASERQLEENPYAFRVRALLEAEGGEWTGTLADLRDKLRFLDGPDWGQTNRNIQTFRGARDRMAGPMRETWGIRTMNWKGAGGVRQMRLSIGEVEQ
jgi:hypothetical protein